jgi:hypothetical protein
VSCPWRQCSLPGGSWTVSALRSDPARRGPISSRLQCAVCRRSHQPPLSPLVERDDNHTVAASGISTYCSQIRFPPQKFARSTWAHIFRLHIDCYASVSVGNVWIFSDSNTWRGWAPSSSQWWSREMAMVWMLFWGLMGACHVGRPCPVLSGISTRSEAGAHAPRQLPDRQQQPVPVRSVRVPGTGTEVVDARYAVLAPSCLRTGISFNSVTFRYALRNVIRAYAQLRP